jgi:hypothetical protein
MAMFPRAKEMAMRVMHPGKTASIVAAAMIVMASGATGALAQAKIDLTGKWLFTVETTAGTGTPTVTLKQDGEKLTGHYSSTNLGEADLTGTVKGQGVNFTFEGNVQGNAVPVTYAATIENKDAMKGTIDIGGVATGTFTGKRQ